MLASSSQFYRMPAFYEKNKTTSTTGCLCGAKTLSLLPRMEACALLPEAQMTFCVHNDTRLLISSMIKLANKEAHIHSDPPARSRSRARTNQLSFNLFWNDKKESCAVYVDAACDIFNKELADLLTLTLIRLRCNWNPTDVYVPHNKVCL